VSFLDALGKLPMSGGVGFRGVPVGRPEPPGLSIATMVMSTTRDPRLASENFRCGLLLVVLHRTGRDISMLSTSPDDGEVLIMPGSAWSVLCRSQLADTPVVFLEEIVLSENAAQPAGWGHSIADLVGSVSERIATSWSDPPVSIETPGRYCGEWEAREYTRPTAQS